jgi:hypothetical protein
MVEVQDGIVNHPRLVQSYEWKSIPVRHDCLCGSYSWTSYENQRVLVSHWEDHFDRSSHLERRWFSYYGG